MLKGKSGLGWVLIFCIILLFEAFFVFSGCGGGGGSALTGGAPGATGSFSVSINWPSGAGGSKLDLGKTTVLKTIPEDTSYVTVEVVNPSTFNALVPSVKVNRTPDVSNNTVTITNVPAGSVQVRVSAYNSSDTICAYGYNNANIVAGNNPAIAVTLTPGATPPVTPTESPTQSPTVWVYVMSRYPQPHPSYTRTPGVEIAVFAPTPMPTGTFSVSKDGSSPAYMTPLPTPNSNLVNSAYYYGSQPSSVSGPVYLPFPNGVNQRYDLDLNLTGGSELGTYQINVGGNIVSVNQTLSVPSQPTITSPSSGAYFSASSPITVTWNSLGSNFVYHVEASAPLWTTGYASVTNYHWTVHDIRNIDFTNPYTWSSYFMGLSSNTSVTIPANMFPSGSTVIINLMAFNKNYVMNPTYPVGTVKTSMADAWVIIYIN